MASNSPKLKQFANFSRNDISGDGGLLLLEKIESKNNFLKRASSLVNDERDPSKVTHSINSMLKQLVFGLCMGYEDLNDHDDFRLEDFYKICFDKKDGLASDSTLSRLENKINISSIFELNKYLVEDFISGLSVAPKELILDIDWTDIELHGNQEDRHYHGYYRKNCYLPIQVTCGDDLLVNYLRPSNIDGAKYSWAIIGLLVKRLQKEFPNCNLIVRADGGFCRHKFLGWLEQRGVQFIVGIAKNNILLKNIEVEKEKVESLYEKDKKTIRKHKEFTYQAKSWKRERKIIAKIEKNFHGINDRFLCTNMDSKKAKELYKDIYCKRGDAENKIKDLQLDMFGDRMSASAYLANSFRLMLSSLAYSVMLNLKKKYLRNTKLAKSSFATIRLKFLKLATIIKIKTTSVRFEFNNNYPFKEIFKMLLPKLFEKT